MRKILFIFLFLFSINAFSNSKVGSMLNEFLHENEMAKVIVMVEDSNELRYYESEIKESYFNYRDMTAIVKGISHHTQKALVDDILAGSMPAEAYSVILDQIWISNSLLMVVNKEAVAWLASRTDVRLILLDSPVIQIPDPIDDSQDPNPVDEDDINAYEDDEMNEIWGLDKVKELMFKAESRLKYTYGLYNIKLPWLNRDFPELTGESVIVGVLDSGIDASHPDLQGKLINFRNFMAMGEDPLMPVDEHGHGTHVSGTIAGGNLSGYQIGVAPKASIVAAAAIGEYSTEAALIKAMEWMVDPDADPETNDHPRVINCSWGGPAGMPRQEQEPMYKALAFWDSANIIPVFAMGNESIFAQSSPQEFPSTFTVAATNEIDLLAWFSTRGPLDFDIGEKIITLAKPEVSAPGTRVYSTFLNGEYKKMSGTSMAAPHVTGAIALLLQIDPEINADEIKELLISTSKDLGSDGWDKGYGNGRIDVYEAAKELISRRW
ncbi:MAG: S8 family serine peptidase [Pseudomonadota bacterium]